MKKLFGTLALVSLVVMSVNAQKGWKWPEDSATKVKAEEMNVITKYVPKAEMDGFRHMGAAQDNDSSVILRSVSAVLAGHQHLRDCRLELFVFSRNGEAHDRLGIDRANLIVHVEGNLSTPCLHFRDHGRLPVDAPIKTVLCGQSPSRDPFTRRDFQLRMVPCPAQIEATGEADILVSCFVKIQKRFVLRFTDVDSIIDHFFHVIIQSLRRTIRTQ